ncbi:MAG: hypothetical protein ACR2QV_12710 [Gammaproteobacteria bacterium]
MLALATPAQADSHFELLDSRFQVYLGGFFPSIDSKISVSGDVLPENPELSFEEVLGLEDSDTLLWGGARWKISRRNNLEFEFVNLEREGTKTLITDEIQIGDIIVQAGGRIDSTFDTTVGRLTYGFSLVSNDRMDIQLKAGLHIADLSASIQFSGMACEVTDPNNPTCVAGSSPVNESEDVTAPLPHFGGSFVYGITPSIAARLQIIGFAIELDSIDGSLVELDADFVWLPWENVGFGAGVRYFNADVESKGSDLNGSFEFEYFGPAIYILGAF